jgi:hypothetical protein
MSDRIKIFTNTANQNMKQVLCKSKEEIKAEREKQKRSHS